MIRIKPVGNQRSRVPCYKEMHKQQDVAKLSAFIKLEGNYLQSFTDLRVIAVSLSQTATVWRQFASHQVTCCHDYLHFVAKYKRIECTHWVNTNISQLHCHLTITLA